MPAIARHSLLPSIPKLAVVEILTPVIEYVFDPVYHVIDVTPHEPLADIQLKVPGSPSSAFEQSPRVLVQDAGFISKACISHTAEPSGSTYPAEFSLKDSKLSLVLWLQCPSQAASV
jgi:hypothetical protein